MQETWWGLEKQRIQSVKQKAKELISTLQTKPVHSEYAQSKLFRTIFR